LPGKDAGGVPIKIDSPIQPVGNSDPGNFAGAVRRYEQAYAKQAITLSPAKEDVVEISGLARLLSQDDQAQAVRWALVEKVKAEISAGSYDAPGKVDQVLEQLMGDLKSHQ
jgi:anti-sigma28 factor (negative regulator of flagellin synthesis)